MHAYYCELDYFVELQWLYAYVMGKVRVLVLVGCTKRFKRRSAKKKKEKSIGP